ncbi:hypothetical protein ACFL6P_08725, partial [Candidatus Latescibacterota bacterium]
MISQEIKQYRLGLIMDSLSGICYHLPNPEVILFPFLDNLLLLHQRPLVFAFWRGKHCVYSSLNDPDFLSRYSIKWDVGKDMLIDLPGIHYRMSAHDFRSPENLNDQDQVVLSIDQEVTQLTRDLISEINTSEKFQSPETFFKALEKSIDIRVMSKSPSHNVLQSVGIRKHIELDYQEVKEFLEPIRLVLDDVFSDSIRAGHLTMTKGSLEYPNIFAVIRTSPSSKPRYNKAFRYTAGLLLLSEMKRALQDWCVNSCLHELQYTKHNCPLGFTIADDCISILEQPLSLNSRSVSDLVFSSGVVDFGRKASEYGWDFSVAGDDHDEDRRNAERCIYPSKGSLFYIPIHVGGTTWISIFTFTHEDPYLSPKAWHHNYSFYRDLVQKVAEMIRQKAHDVYTNLIAKTLLTHMESWLTPKNKII